MKNSEGKMTFEDEDFDSLRLFEKQFSFSSDFGINDYFPGIATSDRSLEIMNIPVKPPPPKKAKKCYWSDIEESILAGIALLFFASRHSLKEGKGAKKREKPSGTVSAAWIDMHRIYDKARKRYNLVHDANLPERTANALNKKWKDSGCRSNSLFDIFETTPKSISHLHNFLNQHNKNQVLTCSDEKFQRLLQQQNANKSVRMCFNK